MEIALFKVNQLGDNVAFLSVVQTLRRLRPDFGLTLFTSPVAAPLYEAAIPRERLVIVERESFNRSWKRPWRMLAWIRLLRARSVQASLLSYDQGSVAHLIAKAAGGPVRVGSAVVNIRLPHNLTHRVPCASGQSIAEWNWEMGRTLCTALGEDGWPAQPAIPDLSHIASRRLSGGLPRLLIHSGGSRAYQRWPAERFAEVAAMMGDAAEVVWVEPHEVAGTALPGGVRRIRTDTIADLIREIAACDLFLCNNSGPMHLASALGAPLVVLTGPTIPQWDPAWHREKAMVLRRDDLACQPCDRMEGAPNRCLLTTEPSACLLRWHATDVARVCKDWLARWRMPPS